MISVIFCVVDCSKAVPEHLGYFRAILFCGVLCGDHQILSPVTTLNPSFTLHMAPARRQSSSSKPPPPTSAPSVIATPTPRPVAPPQPTSKLKIHPLLEVYEATISSLIRTLSDDPFRPESMQDITRRLLQCEQELEAALEEGTTLLESRLTVQ
jgi:hypothetical protein